MILNQSQILELIPQRTPIVMVDSAEVNDTDCAALLTITPTNWFLQDDYVLEAGLMEHQAQSVAVCLGYTAKALNSKTKNIGFIAEVKNLNIASFPKVGEQLRTEIELTATVDDVLLINATTQSGCDPIASSQLKIFLPS